MSKSLKNHVVLNEKNFNRLKKNLSKHINVKQNILADSLSKSIGFDNYHHAQQSNFKTDKFGQSEKIKQNHDDLIEIIRIFEKRKEVAENLLIFNHFGRNEDLNIFKNQVQKLVFDELLNTKGLIISNLKKCLNIEINYDIEFDFSLWLKILNESNYFKNLFIGMNIIDLLIEILSSLKKENCYSVFLKKLEALMIEKEKESLLKNSLFYIPSDTLKNIFILLYQKEKKIDILEFYINEVFYKKYNEDFFNNIDLVEIKTILLFINNDPKFNDFSFLLNSNVENLLSEKIFKLTKDKSIKEAYCVLKLLIEKAENKDEIKNRLNEKIKTEYIYLLNIKEVRDFFKK